MPHFINQCYCYQVIDYLADDVKQLYTEIRKVVSDELFSGGFIEPKNSCYPINQALYWLSSGNTRDAGDLYQRFILALTYIKMNGTSWNQNSCGCRTILNACGMVCSVMENSR